MHIYYAKTIADDLVSQLQPFCEIVNLAGSIRRKKEDVKDIEIVCIPKRKIQEDKNLFQEVIRTTKVIDPDFERILRTMGNVIKGNPAGRNMQIDIERVVDGCRHMITVDVWMPQAHDYYRQFAIRTGSADYSKRFIALNWTKKGWCGTEHGLRKISECYKQSESKWAVRKEYMERATQPPVWQNEQEVFRWLGVQYLEPEHRNL